MGTTARLGAIAVLLVLGLPGLLLAPAACAPNEAIVCNTASTNTGASCTADYELCAGGTDRLECSPVASGVSCKCIENGTTKRTFESSDACNVSPDTLKKRASENCNWKLDEE